MLITKFIEIKVNIGNKGFLKNFKPDIEIDDIIHVPPSFFKRGKDYDVEVECDYCHQRKFIKLNSYYNSIKKINKYCCKNYDCMTKKRTELKELGINKPEEKRRKTNIEKYGVDTPLKNKELLQKMKNTNMEKYGVENVFQSELIKERSKQTLIEKYGVDHSHKSKEVRKKFTETILEKFGVENPMQNKELKKKAIQTNLDRYGKEHITQSEKFRLEKYTLCNNPNYISYNSNTKESTFICDCGEDHTFYINSWHFKGRERSKLPLCTVCHPIGDSTSIKQQELQDFIQQQTDLQIISNYRDVKEIDIYIPDLKVGYEFNGLYWHSEINKDKNYHQDKTKYFQEKGIKVIHIWEDDWDNKKEIIKSQVKNTLGLSEKIHARQTKVKDITTKEAIEFLEQNHIQGGYPRIKVAFGLYREEELVSVMTFDNQEGRKQMLDTEYNLSRFCNKLNTVVVGGASKLFKHFTFTYNPTRVVSYADADWSSGNLYKTLDFEEVDKSKPDYKYIVNGKREHKSKWRKPKGEERTEKEIMEELGIPRIYDCGKIKYEYKHTQTQHKNGKTN